MKPKFSFIALIAGNIVSFALSSFASAQIGTERVASGFSQPTFATSLPGQSNTMVVIEKTGDIKTVNTQTGTISEFLNLSSLVDTGNGMGDPGLHGIAFDPGYASNGRFYVQYTDSAHTESLHRMVNTGAGFTNETLYQVTPDDLAIHANNGTHLGGWIGFGPDGKLYSSLGDGSGQAWDPRNRSQTVSYAAGSPDALQNKEFLGKILRLDVSGPTGYTIPVDNPFGNEVYALGLRNAWRMSFDKTTGKAWIADVGQYSHEELNSLSASALSGANFQWNFREGNGTTPNAEPSSTMGHQVGPIYTYDHTSGGNAITGGYVYRGPLTALQGQYFFGDFVKGKVWSFDINDPNHVLTDWTSTFNTTGGQLKNIVSFGEADNGDLYIVDFNGSLYKVVPEPGSALLVMVAGLGLVVRRRK